MEDEYDWREFDPNNLKTHPPELAHVQLKYADGRQYSTLYSRELDRLESTTVVSWRYVARP
ncbi:MAG TPA: hypothetical protein VGM27_09115 [Acidobacteriaceae bacterium]|jgi:hypothetical protein